MIVPVLVLYLPAIADICTTFVAALAAVDLPGVDAVEALPALSASVLAALKRRRGRPRKFDGPSRALTLTLPESILAVLAEIDPDPSRAIVQLAMRKAAVNGKPPAELAIFGDQAVITIRRTPALERRTGIRLVPLPDGRALISFDHPKTTAELELTLTDALARERLDADEREVFEAIVAILQEARRTGDATLHRRNIVVLESMRRARDGRKQRRRLRS
jgi:hypothetical protein